MTLPWNDPLAVTLTAAIQRGQADELARLLRRHDGLARTRIVKTGEAAGSRTLAHLYADWPGHRRNPRAIITTLREAGADVDTPILDPEVSERPLHWAACNDDVELVEALLDAGADREAPGSIFGGGTPMSSAVNCGAWRCARLLVRRGATTNLYQAAALGLRDQVQTYLARHADLAPDEITTAFWGACLGGRRNTAELLLARGADINWVGWGEQTPLDLAYDDEVAELIGWLRERGARRGPAAVAPNPGGGSDATA